MKFIKIEDIRINVKNIIKYYEQESDGFKYVVMSYIDGNYNLFKNITVEEIDKLINPPSTPKPRGVSYCNR